MDSEIMRCITPMIESDTGIKLGEEQHARRREFLLREIKHAKEELSFCDQVSTMLFFVLSI
jgi:hypothetical protein